MGAEAAEVRGEGFDELVLLQRDLHKEPPAQRESLALNLRPLRAPLNVMRGAMENMTAGRDGNLFDFFRASFALKQGEISIVAASDTLLSSTEKVLKFVQRIFDHASSKDMNNVLEAANNMQMSLHNYRERLRDRAQDFNREIQRVKRDEVIPKTAAFMSKEIRDLRPVIKENVKEFLRLLRAVNWGQGYRHRRVQLFMMEPAIVNGAAQICEPISGLLQDYDDLTERGFCRIASPVVQSISSTLPLKLATVQLQRRREELLALQSVTMPPTWGEPEAPALLDVAQHVAETAGALLGVGMDTAHWINTTVGGVLRERLRCPEMLSSSALRVTHLWQAALGLAVLSAWQAAA